MTCFSPLTGFRDPEGRIRTTKGAPDPRGPERPEALQAITLACGQCIGCRARRTRDWAIRCIHEAQMHKRNSFVTLTYADEELPPDWSLDRTHFPKFIRKLRKHLAEHRPGEGVRYFHCGEYGEKNFRPHYHAILFGQDFSEDRIQYSRGKHPLYISATLDELWGKGFATIGEVTMQSASYVAGYIMKKANGEEAKTRYRRTDGEESWDVIPEYTTMSRRPGIGSEWYDEYKNDVYSGDQVVTLGGRIYSTPKFYDRKLEEEDPDFLEYVKAARKERAKEHSEHARPERLRVRNELHKRKAKVRNL